MVDDSLVRGTTSKGLVQMIRAAGAREVHLRLGSPPITGPCHYGIDTPEREDLVAHRLDLPRIRQFLDADSVAYLPIEDVREAVGGEGGRFCDACFTGNYPVEPVHRRPDGQLPLFDGGGG